MKKTRIRIALMLLCLVMAAVTATLAESHEEEKAEAPPAPSLWPIEIYTCNFNEGQTMADLMEVSAAWSAWMDENGRTEYWASLLIPTYHSSEITFDVAWVGGWQSGAAMAESTEYWITNGGEHQAAFERVVDCDQHVNFAVYTVQPNPIPFQPGPVQFTDCTLEEGAELAAAIDGVHKWAAHEGDQTGHYLQFPAFGESSEADYNFKWVEVSSYEAFGAAYDDFGTGGGWRKYEEMFDGLLDCDSPRVYHGINVRKVDLGD